MGFFPRGRRRFTHLPTGRSTGSGIDEKELEMTDAPGMRELARRLLEYEADAGKTSDPMESPTLRVYEKLRSSLGEFVGAAAFQSLAKRALILARPDTLSLSAAWISEDGSLRGQGEIENQFDIDNDGTGEGGIILIARLLGLLRLFLGEAMTLNLMQNAWPGEALDDRNSKLGRKHD